MNLIRRASAVTAATVIAALVTSASACGGATTATRTTTNGLEKKASAEVLQAAAAALTGAASVHVVFTGPQGHADVRIQKNGSATGTLTLAGDQIKVTIIGKFGYINTGQAGLRAMGAPPPVQRHGAGRWLKVTKPHFNGVSLADLASQLTAYRAGLEPKVRQATINGRKVVVVTWRDGARLYVANAGPAYPLRVELKKGPNAGLIEFTEYGALFHITAPSNFIDLSNAG